MNESDEALWSQAIEGQHASYGLIFQRHAEDICNHCFRRVASFALAEDLTSVVFLEAWRKRNDSIFVEQSIRPWLFGIATNVCHNAVTLFA